MTQWETAFALSVLSLRVLYCLLMELLCFKKHLFSMVLTGEDGRLKQENIPCLEVEACAQSHGDKLYNSEWNTLSRFQVYQTSKLSIKNHIS